MRKITQIFGVIFTFLCIATTIYSQTVPELIYYRFHNNTPTTTFNFASSPVGTNPSPFTSCNVTSGGQFDSCIVGTGATGTSGVLPGWNWNVTGNWTISMWVSNLTETVAGSPTYLFGDPGSTSFRCFYGGLALPNNCLLRGPMTDLYFACPMPGTKVITIVYNGTTVTVYGNGVQIATEAATFTMPTGTGFRVAGYTGGAYGLSAGGKMDEFRLYNRALTPAEVLATWNIELGAAPPTVCSFAVTPQTSGTTSLLQAVSTVNNNVAWISGAAATVRRTVNGGATWTNANPNPGVITGDIYSMFATDSSNCLLTTSPGATFIYRTTNGGTNWTQVFTQPGGFIDGIVMTTPLLGFAYGDPVSARWSLWRTSNGGVTWDSTGLYLPQAGTEAGWNNALKIIGTNIWFGTSNTRVYHSSNSGLTWTFGVTTGDPNSQCLHFNSATEGFAGGLLVNKTTNGGSTYANVTAPGTGGLTGMSGGALTYYWYTRGTNIYNTTNSGTSWSTAYTGTTALWGIDIQTVNGCPRGWAVGATGTVIKIGNDTLVGISNNNNNNQVPEAYSLKQNYPNPFNPSTQIQFGLPKSGTVKLVIFDILGREVKTLVNGFKAAGTYNISFDASSLASGIYFYTIKANDFTETKKMLLVK